MAFVVVVFVFMFFFYIYFKRLTCTSYETTCEDMASDRTQRFHLRTAKQMVDAALGEIAPEDAEKLWVSLVQSKIVAQQTNDEAIDFKLSSRYSCRMLQERRTLGITKRNLIYYVRQNGFRNLAKLASWSYSVQV